MNKLFVVLFLFVAMSAYAQWEPDVRLTNDFGDSYTSANSAWCIAANGNVLHIIWFDERDGNREIYYKRSTDGGTTWGAETRLTNNIAESWYPSIAVSGNIVHVVWRDYRDVNYEIYYKRSTDGGINWGADTRLTNNTAGSHPPSIAVSGSLVHVVWYDYRDGYPNFEIYYKRSTDGGVTWEADTRLTNNASSSLFPSIAVSGSFIHVVWYDKRDGNEEIYYKRSTDGGINWGADTRLTNNTATSNIPSIAVSGSLVHVVWYDYRDGNYEIYYKRSTDNGLTWGADIRLTNNFGWSTYSSIAVSGLLVHVVWEEDRDWNNEIYYKRSTDGGINWGADTRLTNDASSSSYPFIDVFGSLVHVVWSDNRNGNFEIYYKRNPTGNLPTGIQNISTETPSKYSLSQNYPNPFNPTTNIKFSIVNSGDVKLIVFDIMGKEVQTLVNERLQPSTYEATFDGSSLNSGVYFYKLMTDGYNEAKKMLLIK
jgi:hypothetical protein